MSFNNPCIAFGDVLSNYSELAIQFRNISKEYEILSQRGKYNLKLLKHEMIPVLYETGMRAYFFFNSKREDDDYNMFIGFVVLSMPNFFDNDNVMFTYRSFAPCSNSNDNEEELGYTYEIRASEDKPTVTNKYIEGHVERIMEDADIYLDIVTVYKIYSRRICCINNVVNYAKNKTVEYFNYVDRILHLHVYLAVNAMILRIHVPKEFLPRYISEVEYDKFVDIYTNMRTQIYDDILNKINTFTS